MHVRELRHLNANILVGANVMATDLRTCQMH